MDAEQASHPVARMADLLAVSRSGYYAWTKREQAGPSAAQQRRHVSTRRGQPQRRSKGIGLEPSAFRQGTAGV